MSASILFHLVMALLLCMTLDIPELENATSKSVLQEPVQSLKMFDVSLPIAAEKEIEFSPDVPSVVAKEEALIKADILEEVPSPPSTLLESSVSEIDNSDKALPSIVSEELSSESPRLKKIDSSRMGELYVVMMREKRESYGSISLVLNIDLEGRIVECSIFDATEDEDFEKRICALISQSLFEISQGPQSRAVSSRAMLKIDWVYDIGIWIVARDSAASFDVAGKPVNIDRSKFFKDKPSDPRALPEI